MDTKIGIEEIESIFDRKKKIKKDWQDRRRIIVISKRWLEHKTVEIIGLITLYRHLSASELN